MNKYIQTEGELFELVQKSGVFCDCKTFVDACPVYEPEKIMDKFRNEKDKADFNLEIFVKENFKLPDDEKKEVNIPSGLTMKEHILNLWDYLKRDAHKEIKSASLIHLPFPYIVPGGRFREIYYWDSYFTSEGLALSGKIDMVENMVKNFSFLIEKFGHIPNGNREYYISRSQPPFFCSMVEILVRYKGPDSVLPYLDSLEKEYFFWMKGREELSENIFENSRVILLDNIVLNRYWDDKNIPREESYREDVELYEKSRKNKDIYRNIRAACESGWDFSGRWFQDGHEISTIRTTDILPVDLNSILYNMEKKLSQWFFYKGDTCKGSLYEEFAEKRKYAVNKYFWNEEKGFYFDYLWKERNVSFVWSLAGVYPLFFNIAFPEQGKRIAEVIEDKFLYPGGLVTTLNETGQQWDKPNGWAPLHWIAVKGLLNYGYDKLAKEISGRFLNLTEKVFEKTGKMMEKYNVCDLSLEAGGGEYPLQDGFGWTNGVVLALTEEWKNSII